LLNLIIILFDMETIQWVEKMSVDNSMIDNQHRQLIALTNNLILHSDAETNSQIINEALSELLKYVKDHFQQEEKWLLSMAYPKLDEHRREHKKFLYEVAMFTKDVFEQKTTVTKELILFLSNWIVHHTMEDDQDYKNYIQG